MSELKIQILDLMKLKDENEKEISSQAITIKNQKANLEKNNLRRIFSGKWIYEITPKNRLVFRIVNDNEIKFQDEETIYRSSILSSWGSHDILTIILHNDEQSNEDLGKLKLKVIKIKRTNQAKKYEGEEICVDYEKEEFVYRYQQIKIYEYYER